MAEIKYMNPVGTLDELAKHGLDAAEYGSCAPRIINAGGNMTRLGCEQYEFCKLKCKESGPENVPMRLFKRNGKILEAQRECHQFVKLERECDASGGQEYVELIDGDSYNAMGTVPEKGLDGRVTNVDTITLKKIEKFPRISENPALVANAYHGAAMERAREERKKRAINQRLGMPDDAA